MAKTPMTPRERAIYEHNKRKLAAQKRKKRAVFLSYASKILIMGLAAAALFGAVLAVTIMLNFNSSPEKYSYTAEIILDGNQVPLSKPLEVKNNRCYISLHALSDVLGFALSGDVNEMSAVFDNGDILSFKIGTDSYSVNGIERSCDGASFMVASRGDVYVPINVFNGSFEGITLERNSKNDKVNYRLNVNSDFKASFSLQNPLPMPDMSQLSLSAEPESPFITDLSAYEQYMNPENPDEYILLINSDYTLDASYEPADLTNISYTRKDGRATQRMRLAAAKSLDAMLTELYAHGFTDVSVTSAYRDYNYQKQLFDNKLSYYMQYYDYDTAYAKTAKENAVPGTSEHQSGLCADLHNLPSASQAFESQEAYRWLVAHCADFGFILRYPKNKQDITKIIYEPWHYRFVGRYHAQKIMQSGLCLEEYCLENGIGLN